MSLVINWQAANGAVKYRLYRDTSKFTLKTLPTDVKEVLATDPLKYEYTDAKRQTVYWFVISSIDADGREVFGRIFPQGYFPETGPGPTTLLRGDWEFGYFGDVLPADLFTYQEIQSQLIADGRTPPPITGNATKWRKCVVNGNIIFIPDAYWGMLNRNGNLVFDKMLYLKQMGFCGNNADITGATVVTKNGFSYRHRLPLVSTNKPTSTIYSGLDVLGEDVLKSEIGMINALGSNSAVTQNAQNASNLNGLTVYRHLNDDVQLAVPSMHQNSAATNNSGIGQWGTTTLGGIGVVGWSFNTNANFYPILELVF